MRKDNSETAVTEDVTSVAQAEVSTETSAEGEKIKDFLQNVLEKMGCTDCDVQIYEKEDAVCLNIFGQDANSVIGRHGEVLDALQYLCSLLLNGKHGNFRRVVIDTEGYREKREKTLKRLASNLESKVKRTGKAVKLEPMNPYERRIIHTALQNSKYVSTESEGTANGRHIIVSPKLTGDILNAPVSRKSLNFVYRSDKKRRR